ncbi:hypothetical protein [Streptomyces sp. NPDC018947]|uniref:hypothetical protein n=1 Tax=Streptomyces sp. NPDC018947 TaxID=3365054 RepID=UPI0037A668AC
MPGATTECPADAASSSGQCLQGGDGVGKAGRNAEGTSNVVYAWGSAEDKNLALATQTLSGTHSTPGVGHGKGGGALAPNSSDRWPGWAAAGAVAVPGVLTALRGTDRSG